MQRNISTLTGSCRVYFLNIKDNKKLRSSRGKNFVLKKASVQLNQQQNYVFSEGK